MKTTRLFGSALFVSFVWATSIFSAIPDSIWQNDTLYHDLWNRRTLDTTQFWPPSRARTSTRRTMPSVPGAVEICDRLAIIDRGRIKALGSPAELKIALGGLKGPLMKVAQILSTIPEALPPEYAQELSQLQANAPHMGWPFVNRQPNARQSRMRG